MEILYGHAVPFSGNISRTEIPIFGSGDSVPVTPCFTSPLAVAEAFAHNPILTTAREQATKTKTEISIARRFPPDSYEPDL